MRLVIAPDSFKGTVDAFTAAKLLAEGWARVRPADSVDLVPLADGGEGTADVIASAEPAAKWHRLAAVTGPDGQPVPSRWLELPDGTGVIALADPCGLPLLDRPDPLGAHTIGLGETIAAALDAGATRLLIGLGGSASTDGGSGLLRALGARFCDTAGRELKPGGGALKQLASVDLTRLLAPPPDGVQCLTDVESPLLGPAGAAAVFGPQKGAGAADIEQLEEGLTRLAELLGGSPEEPGAGAAGGVGYGLTAAWGAHLVPGAAAVAEVVGLAERLAAADLVLTGEGGYDVTSLRGKVVGQVVALARAAGCRYGVVAGRLADAPPEDCAVSADLTELAGGSAAARSDPKRWLVEVGATLAGAVDGDS